MRTDYAEALRAFAAAAEQDGARGAANAYREWAEHLDHGGAVDSLPPAGRATIAAIEEGER